MTTASIRPPLVALALLLLLLLNGCDRLKEKTKSKAQPIVVGSATVDSGPGPMMTVLVASAGISIASPDGNIGPDCTKAGPGLAVPAINEQQDFAGLRRCAETLKASYPGLASQRSITIVADKAIAFATVIATMDAVRSTKDGQDLFPDVSFGTAP